jgi:hypothetical protein
LVNFSYFYWFKISPFVFVEFAEFFSLTCNHIHNTSTGVYTQTCRHLWHHRTCNSRLHGAKPLKPSHLLSLDKMFCHEVDEACGILKEIQVYVKQCKRHVDLLWFLDGKIFMWSDCVKEFAKSMIIRWSWQKAVTMGVTERCNVAKSMLNNWGVSDNFGYIFALKQLLWCTKNARFLWIKITRI